MRFSSDMSRRRMEIDLLEAEAEWLALKEAQGESGDKEDGFRRRFSQTAGVVAGGSAASGTSSSSSSGIRYERAHGHIAARQGFWDQWRNYMIQEYFPAHVADSANTVTGTGR